MPLEYVFYEQRRRFIVTLTGEVTLDQLASFVASQITRGSWRHSVLYDATAPGVTLRPLETMPIDLWRELTHEYGARGLTVWAVADDVQREIVTRYVEAAAEAALFVSAVFSEVGQAQRWLDDQEAAARNGREVARQASED
jgi:hypothetical protein